MHRTEADGSVVLGIDWHVCEMWLNSVVYVCVAGSKASLGGTRECADDI